MPSFRLASRRARRILSSGVPFALLAAVGACDDDPSGPAATPVRGVVVLNGYIAQGVSVIDTALAARGFVGFDAGFDGGSFLVERDTALSTSSKGGGDKLYVASLTGGTVRTVQLPAASNPAGTVFLPSSAGVTRIGVALRDSSAVAVVAIPAAAGAAATVTLLRGAGRCPTEVIVRNNDTWSVDANANCRTDYSVVGPTRLIRIAADGQRDTLSFPMNAVGSGISVVQVGDIAYVGASGNVDFATGAVTARATISQVNLATRQYLGGVTLPDGMWGASLHLGRNGLLYATSYDVSNGYANRTFAIDGSGRFVGAMAPERQYLRLAGAGGTQATCAAVAVDAASQLYCLSNGTGGAARVTVFDVSGNLLRSGDAGQGGVDIALR